MKEKKDEIDALQANATDETDEEHANKLQALINEHRESVEKIKKHMTEETEQVITIFNQGYYDLSYNFRLFYAVTVDVLRDWDICIRIKIQVQDDASVILEGCFSGWLYLKSIEIPDSVERIEPFAFDGCELLQEVNLSPSTRYIQNSAFRGCQNLSAIRLPDVLETNSKEDIID